MTRQVMVLSLCLAMLLSALTVDGRYLPTRGQEDRLDRLRDLLRDRFERCRHIMKRACAIGQELV
ncbi:hypothetical protein J6590_008445 [Homalodisca vitripennis]|nr:hypothetical protein J6590_008445 [Homalodisca vitripennis]